MNQENEEDGQPTWIDEQRLKFDQNFDKQFFVGLEALMGRKPNVEKRLVFTGHLFEAVQAYEFDQLELEDFKNEKEENEALEKVSKKANQLYDAIMDLHGFGQTESKLANSIKACERLYKDSNGMTFDHLLAQEHNPFFTLREFLVDLQVCAEKMVNRKPKLDVYAGILDGTGNSQLDQAKDLADRTKEWRNTSAAHRIPKDYAIQRFLGTFKDLWISNSEHPFTEGMHYGEIGKTVSPAVDAVQMIMQRLDSKVTRQNIVTAMRKV